MTSDWIVCGLGAGNGGRFNRSFLTERKLPCNSNGTRFVERGKHLQLRTPKSGRENLSRLTNSSRVWILRKSVRSLGQYLVKTVHPNLVNIHDAFIDDRVVYPATVLM